VGIVGSWTKATEFVVCVYSKILWFLSRKSRSIFWEKGCDGSGNQFSDFSLCCSKQFCNYDFLSNVTFFFLFDEGTGNLLRLLRTFFALSKT
jgi:hypothetical protein